MKNLLLLLIFAATIIISGCQEESLMDVQTTIESTEEISALPDPDLMGDTKVPQEDDALFEPLEVSEEASERLEMPERITESPLQVETRSSCAPHFDYPVFYGRFNRQLIVHSRTICREGEYAAGGALRTNQLGSDYWDLMIGLDENNTFADNKGLYLAYSRAGKMQVGSIDRYGIRRSVKDYTWVDYWTKLVPLEDRMFLFHSDANAAIFIGYITAGGDFKYLNFFWWTGWTHIVHLGNNKILAYNKGNGKVQVIQIGHNGSWKVLKKTSIRSGLTHILPLGRQSKVEKNVCCNDYGTGFMGYHSGNKSVYIYVAKDGNGVELRKTYYYTSWQFHNLTQLKGGKFIANVRGGEPQSSNFYIGNIDNMGNLRWESFFRLPYDEYRPVFTMHFE